MKKPTKKSLVAGKKTKKKTLTGIDLLVSKGYKSSFRSLAMIMSGRMDLIFAMERRGSSFTGFSPKDNKPYMNIDLWTLEDEKLGTSHYHILAKALIYHESSHLLYSDFSVVRNLNQQAIDVRNEVESIASEYHASEDDDVKDDLKLQLREKISDFVFKVNMPETTNLFEDLAVDRYMCEKGKEQNGCLNFEYEIYQEQRIKNLKEALDSDAIPLEERCWNDTTLRAVCGEVQAFGQIGYKKPYKSLFLSELFDEDEIKKMKDLAIYSRFSAPSTYERAGAAKSFLTICLPILENIAEELTDRYINNIDKAKEIADEMSEKAEKSSTSTTSSGDTSGTGGTSSGGSSSMPTPPSKYDLGVPESLKKEIEESAKEMGKEESEEGSDDSSGETESSSEETSEEGKSKSSSEELEEESKRDIIEALSSAEKTFKKSEERVEKETLTSEDVREGESAAHYKVPVEITEIENSLEVAMDYSYSGELASEYITKKELSGHVNDLSKKMKKILMHRGQDDVSRGRFDGAIDMTGLYRIKTDCQVFKKEIVGQKNKVRFAILVDESGSMSGNNMKMAIIGCWMVAKAAQKLKIPFAVYGHDEKFSNNTFRLRKYISFEKSNKIQSLNNIFHMEAHQNNRDGLAIYHSLRELAKTSEQDEDLYLFVLSDGQPAASEYSGRQAIEDMQKIMNTFKKHYNVHSVGIGIGDFDGFDSVRDIYENSVCVSEPERLPAEMFKIFKKMLRV